MEAALILLLAVTLGVPSAWRWLAFGLLGPAVLLTVFPAPLRGDFGALPWFAAAAAVAMTIGAWLDARENKRRAARGEPPISGWPYNRINGR